MKSVFLSGENRFPRKQTHSGSQWNHEKFMATFSQRAPSDVTSKILSVDEAAQFFRSFHNHRAEIFSSSLSRMIYWHIASKGNHENQIFWPRDEKNFWTSQQEAKTWSKFGLVRKKYFFFAKNRLIFNFLCLGIFSNANRLVPKHMFRSQCLFGLSSSLAKANNEKVSQIMKTQWFLDDRWIVIQFV